MRAPPRQGISPNTPLDASALKCYEVTVLLISAIDAKVIERGSAQDGCREIGWMISVDYVSCHWCPGFGRFRPYISGVLDFHHDAFDPSPPTTPVHQLELRFFGACACGAVQGILGRQSNRCACHLPRCSNRLMQFLLFDQGNAQIQQRPPCNSERDLALCPI